MKEHNVIRAGAPVGCERRPRGKTPMRRIGLLMLLVLSLPILLFVYQPALPLGGTAFILGTIGRTLSPLILFGALAYVIATHWK